MNNKRNFKKYNNFINNFIRNFQVKNYTNSCRKRIKYQKINNTKDNNNI